jgi:hypothetical protein
MAEEQQDKTARDETSAAAARGAGSGETVVVTTTIERYYPPVKGEDAVVTVEAGVPTEVPKWVVDKWEETAQKTGRRTFTVTSKGEASGSPQGAVGGKRKA